MIYQRTIEKQIETIGVGMHSGQRVKLTLCPAPINHGIVFIRTDLKDEPSIKCHPFLINDTRLSSTLVTGHIRVATIEHLLSAFACLGIDNIVVKLSSSEVPIMDGSSNSFLYLINQAHVIEQKSCKNYIKINQPIEVEDNDKWVKLLPFNGFKVKATINFSHPLFTEEYSTLEINFSHQSYIDEISRARTFGFMHEVETLRNQGLGLGGNLQNAIVINEQDIINDGGLRFPDEFVRHKILDIIGDLYILGNMIIGAFEGYKPGHNINNKLLRKLISTPSSWEYVTFENNIDKVPNSFHAI